MWFLEQDIQQVDEDLLELGLQSSSGGHSSAEHRWSLGAERLINGAALLPVSLPGNYWSCAWQHYCKLLCGAALVFVLLPFHQRSGTGVCLPDSWSMKRNIIIIMWCFTGYGPLTWGPRIPSQMFIKPQIPHAQMQSQISRSPRYCRFVFALVLQMGDLKYCGQVKCPNLIPNNTKGRLQRAPLNRKAKTSWILQKAFQKTWLKTSQRKPRHTEIKNHLSPGFWVLLFTSWEVNDWDCSTQRRNIESLGKSQHHQCLSRPQFHVFSVPSP